MSRMLEIQAKITIESCQCWSSK